MVQDYRLKKALSGPPHLWWVVSFGVAAIAALATSATYVWRVSSTGQAAVVVSSPGVSTTVTASTVTALGRLEPQGEVLRLSVASGLSSSNRVAQLRVKEGDRVRAGAVIAVMDSYVRLQAAVLEAESQVAAAEARLAQVQAGSSQEAIAAQDATVRRLQAELAGQVNSQTATTARLQAEVENARLEYDRYQSLYREGAVSASLRDSKALTWQTAQEQLQVARADLARIQESLQAQIQSAEGTLNQLAEVRPTDVAVAQASVSMARASLQRARSELDLAYVRAPRDGQILKIHTHEGEVIGSQGIVEFGQTDHMYAIAEVYEGDITRVQPGQTAILTSNNLTTPLRGKVEQVGLLIAKQDVLNTDPTAATDARVVEVRIRLDEEDSRRVRGLSNLQVKVEIKVP